MKKLVMVLGSSVLLLTACGGDDTNDEGATNDGATTEQDQVFTLEELSEYDGQDGNDAYVAVDGIVYDVTDVGAWAGGEHAPAGGLEAGGDRSEEIEASPHGTAVLEDLPIVGTLEGE
ncbi:putative heme/steroid binding protein [Alkalihalobacillus xiaoxiensis]|uniref:Heme/steroid binding protein n=1 Tax=Shouchella xiaoxiensis TaxID=766895 RepID=A0ABS2SZP3_9BACI|nr:putative heme/steroid binding protein [Shouchella xiaoxiensis]